MSIAQDLRPGEIVVDLPTGFDDGIYFVGRIRTPWKARSECPRQGDTEKGPVCRIEVDPLWREALDGVERHQNFQILYWMDQARRDIVRQSPKSDGNTRGTFSLRSPVRPNPIASSVVRLVGREGLTLLVRGIDCLDGTPLVDVKPVVCDHA